MAEYLIQDSTLTSLADKIRVLSGTEDTMTPIEMVDALDNINTTPENALLLNEISGTAKMPSEQFWSSACYGNGKFVAVAGYSNIAAYSIDGVNWVEANLPSEQEWSSVCYGDGKFVAIPYDGNIAAYSIDGVNWTETNLPNEQSWSSICYGDGKFVIVGYNECVFYSTNGIDWEEADLPEGMWKSICYADGKFVAVGATTAYSTDGINWITSNNYMSWMLSVCYGNGKFVTVVSDSDTVAYSSDGINWTTSTLPSEKYWSSICYGDGKFVVATNNDNVIAYSADGINWTENTLLSEQVLESVCYGAGKFVAVVNNSDIVAFSTDGINWSSEATTATLTTIDGVDVTDETVQKVMPIDSELATQDGLIAKIMTTLEGKMLPSGGSVDTCTVEISIRDAFFTSIGYSYVDDNGNIISSFESVSGLNSITLQNIVCGSRLSVYCSTTMLSRETQEGIEWLYSSSEYMVTAKANETAILKFYYYD